MRKHTSPAETSDVKQSRALHELLRDKAALARAQAEFAKCFLRHQGAAQTLHATVSTNLIATRPNRGHTRETRAEPAQRGEVE